MNGEKVSHDYALHCMEEVILSLLSFLMSDSSSSSLFASFSSFVFSSSSSSTLPMAFLSPPSPSSSSTKSTRRKSTFSSTCSSSSRLLRQWWELLLVFPILYQHLQQQRQQFLFFFPPATYPKREHRNPPFGASHSPPNTECSSDAADHPRSAAAPNHRHHNTNTRNRSRMGSATGRKGHDANEDDDPHSCPSYSYFSNYPPSSHPPRCPPPLPSSCATTSSSKRWTPGPAGVIVLPPPSAMTQRDVYYGLVRDAQDQAVTDRCIRRVQRVLGVSRRSLGIIGGQRGSIGGRGICQIFHPHAIPWWEASLNHRHHHWGRKAINEDEDEGRMKTIDSGVDSSFSPSGGIVQNIPIPGDELYLGVLPWGSSKKYPTPLPRSPGTAASSTGASPFCSSSMPGGDNSGGRSGHGNSPSTFSFSTASTTITSTTTCTDSSNPLRPSQHHQRTHSGTAPILYAPPLFYLSPSTMAIIVVEKYSIYHRLLMEDCSSLFPCIIMTSHGFPTHAARRLLSNISFALRGLNHFFQPHSSHFSSYWSSEGETGRGALPPPAPVLLALGDYNPSGVCIIHQYKFGRRMLKEKGKRKGEARRGCGSATAAIATTMKTAPTPATSTTRTTTACSSPPVEENHNQGKEGTSLSFWRTDAEEKNGCEQQQKEKNEDEEMEEMEMNANIPPHVPDLRWLGIRSHHVLIQARTPFTIHRSNNGWRSDRRMNEDDDPSLFSPPMTRRRKEKVQPLGDGIDAEGELEEEKLEGKGEGGKRNRGYSKRETDEPGEALTTTTLSTSSSSLSSFAVHHERRTEYRYYARFPFTPFTERDMTVITHLMEDIKDLQRAYSDMLQEYDEEKEKKIEKSSSILSSHQNWPTRAGESERRGDFVQEDGGRDEGSSVRRRREEEDGSVRQTSPPYHRSSSFSSAASPCVHTSVTTSSTSSIPPFSNHTAMPASSAVCVETPPRQLVVDLLTYCPEYNPLRSHSGRHQHYEDYHPRVTHSAMMEKKKKKKKKKKEEEEEKATKMENGSSNSNQSENQRKRRKNVSSMRAEVQEGQEERELFPLSPPRKTTSSTASSSSSSASSSLRFLGFWYEELRIMKEAKMKIELDALLDSPYSFSLASGPPPPPSPPLGGGSADWRNRTIGGGAGERQLPYRVRDKRACENPQVEEVVEYENGNNSNNEINSATHPSPSVSSPWTTQTAITPLGASSSSFHHSSIAKSKPFSHWLYQRILQKDYI